MCGLACWLLAAPALADQMVFGSFRSVDNAANWAARLTSAFDLQVTVVVVQRGGVPWHRVQTPDLDTGAYAQMARRAERAGLQFWRLRAPGLETSQNAPDPRPTAPRLAPPIRPDHTPDTGVAARPPDPPAPGPSPPESTESTAPVPQTPPEPARDSATPQARTEWEWDLGIQSRLFSETGLQGQDRYEGSLSVELDYYRTWDNERSAVTVTPFARMDSADSRRSHFDFRELVYTRVGDTWDLHLGAKRVFWGVTEFHHLVDIVNQTDLVENIDTEDKLGQPMVHLSLVRDWGILDLFALAGFRERTFPGPDGRVRLPFRVRSDALYESGAERKRVDAAVRWSHHMGPFELGLHHFSGTSREPLLIPELIPSGLTLRPFYPVIDQTGMDAQAFYGDWAFKLEAITRSGYGDRYAAFNAGFERTLVGAFGTRADFGLVAEYMWDERGDEAVNTLFEHDIALGGRIQFNDFSNTQALVGVVLDTHNHDYVFSLEASRQLSPTWSVSVEGRMFGGGRNLDSAVDTRVLWDPDYKTAWLQQDDYLQLELKKFL